LKKTEITTRGIFIDEHLLCMQVPPPPPGIPALPPAQPGQTRRQQLEQDLVNPSCGACHQLTDPIGDSLEHYDTVGKFNTLDNGSPIDSSGTLPAGVAVGANTTFADVNELGGELAKQCGVSVCLTQQLLADAETSAKLPVPGSADSQVVAEIAFASGSGKLRDLIRNIVESDTFLRAK
jgi:bacterioferritin-associated ferredoxin